jgi:hypothetical protein
LLAFEHPTNSNYIEIRVDAIKLLQGSRRPFPVEVDSIGTWMSILQVLDITSVITNVAMIVTSPSFKNRFDITEQFVGFVLLEHLLIGLKMALSALGKTSVEVEEAVQRQKLFVRKLTLDDDGDEIEAYMAWYKSTHEGGGDGAGGVSQWDKLKSQMVGDAVRNLMPDIQNPEPDTPLWDADDAGAEDGAPGSGGRGCCCVSGSGALCVLFLPLVAALVACFLLLIGEALNSQQHLTDILIIMAVVVVALVFLESCLGEAPMIVQLLFAAVLLFGSVTLTVLVRLEVV